MRVGLKGMSLPITCNKTSLIIYIIFLSLVLYIVGDCILVELYTIV